MIEYPIPEDRAAFSQTHGVLGTSYIISLDFNSTDRKWRFSLANNLGQVIIQGVPLVSGQSPTKKYSLNSLRTGNFWVFAKTKTGDPLAFDNFGFDKSYGLFFVTNEEEDLYDL